MPTLSGYTQLNERTRRWAWCVAPRPPIICTALKPWLIGLRSPFCASVKQWQTIIESREPLAAPFGDQAGLQGWLPLFLGYPLPLRYDHCSSVHQAICLLSPSIIGLSLALFSLFSIIHEAKVESLERHR